MTGFAGRKGPMEANMGRVDLANTNRRVFTGLCCAVLLLLAAAPVLPADAPQDKKPSVKILNKTQVYYPATIKKGATFKKPATLVSSTVFDAIPEWKKIKDKKLTTKDAEYHLLLKAANDKFAKALDKVQKDGSFDIIAEAGAIECKNCVAEDVTQKMVDNIPEK